MMNRIRRFDVHRRKREQLPSRQRQRLGQAKVNKVKNYLPFLKFMKRPQTKFHAQLPRY